jgi:hypothetical protein
VLMSKATMILDKKDMRVNGELDDEETARPGTVSAHAPTLREFFAVPEKPNDQADEPWQKFQDALSDEVKGIRWSAAMSDLAPKIAELFEIKFSDILIKAWKKAEALQKILAESEKNPEKAAYLELTEHGVDYETKPFIDVKIKGASVKKITLPVQLNIKVKGFVLKVQNGAMIEMQCGQCEAKGTVKYGTLTIIEKQFQPIKFPMSIPLEEPGVIATPKTNNQKSPEQSGSLAEAEIKKSFQKPPTEAEIERFEL